MELLSSFVSFVLHIDVHLFELANQYGLWVYAILFVIVFCETGLVVTPFLPGDSLLFASGVVAGAGLLGYGQIMAVLLAAGILGDAVNYLIGRHVGPAIFSRENRFIKKAHLLKAHDFYERHGGKAIVLARFVPIVRTFAPFVAGVARMTYSRFVGLDFLGGFIWIFSLTWLGYGFGNMPLVKKNLTVVILAIIAISLLPVFIGWLKSRRAPVAS